MTEAQKKLLKCLACSEYRSGCDFDEPVWTQEVMRDTGLGATSFGGVVAGAVKAGLVKHCGEGRDSVIYFTKSGWDAWVSLSK